jgi:hypothetical protein
MTTMDDEDFAQLIKGISMDSSQFHDHAAKLFDLSFSAVIRDFSWTNELYDAIWKALSRCWGKLSYPISSDEEKANLLKDEMLLWKTFALISGFPEFDLALACQSEYLTIEAVRSLLSRFLASNGPANITAAKQSLHWIYEYRRDLRSQIRLLISTTVLKDKGGRGLRYG